MTERVRIDFVEAMKISQGVMRRYCEKHPKWARHIEGTPIPNDLAVAYARAIAELINGDSNDAG